VHYGPICALDGISFATQCGRSLALLGPNGAGKSTLLKSIAGIIPFPAGSIHWRGEPMIRQRRHEIAYLPQREEVNWDFPLTVRGLVEMGRYPHTGSLGRFGEQDRLAVQNALDALDLANLADRHIRELSGGQQQRAFLARAVAQGAHVLLLDEPFAGLDSPSTERLTGLFFELKERGHLIIACHHDLANVATLFDEALLLNHHQVAFGPIEKAFNQANLERTFQSAAAASF
jgi:ABC-type Mn2+/Zn2+ transport system ATPase subunit